MANGRPVHGMWCSAALKKTECRFCEKPVFLFFCDCGCMVMLEESPGSFDVHCCRAGLNRFSARDSFLISRALGRKVDTACLDGALVDGKKVYAVIENSADLAANTVSGSVSKVQASFSM